LGDAALAVDHDGRVVAGKVAFETLFGLSPVDWQGLSFAQLCVDPGSRTSAAAARSGSHGQPSARHRYRRRDGTVFWGERSDAPVRGDDGAGIGVFSIIRNVSGRVSLERGLESLLALPGTGSPQVQLGIVKLIELGCRHLDVEFGALGRIEQDHYVVEIAAGSLAVHQPGDQLPLAGTFSSMQRDQDGLVAIEQCSRSGFADHPYHLRTGCEFYCASEIRVEGSLFGTLFFADRSPTRHPLQDHDRLFLRIIARWTGMLLEGRMTKAALGTATQDLERFAHIASHDLQEPLRRVVTYCQILIEDFGTEVSDEAVEVIEIIQTGGKRMRLMLNDLMLYSRLNQQLQQAFEPVDMASIFCHAIDDLTGKPNARHARIACPPLPLVWGRAPLLQMVCHHLLCNAIEFAGKEAPDIDISVQDKGQFWQFGLTDKGIGIEPRFAEKIFDMFQRLHPRDDFSGSGAGLALCKLIVERHGGAIWLDTGYGEGARFLFTLPKDRLPAAPGFATPTRPPSLPREALRPPSQPSHR
jgi:PAS domain S-box-containing protein